MDKRVVALVLTLALVLNASFVFAQEMEGTEGRRGRPHSRQMTRGRLDRGEAKLEKLTKDLSLTSEQQAKVKEIITKTQDSVKAVQDSIKAVLEEGEVKIKELAAKADEGIKLLLTEEQKKKFEELYPKREALPAKAPTTEAPATTTPATEATPTKVPSTAK